MLGKDPRAKQALEASLIGMLTSVGMDGQPQTSPVWFDLDADDMIVYNRADTPRLDSIAANNRVAFTLRGDRRARGMLTLEGTAERDESLPAPKDLDGYIAKYAAEIERLGWTPESFSRDYSVGIRVKVTRVRSFGLEHVIDAESTGPLPPPEG